MRATCLFFTFVVFWALWARRSVEKLVDRGSRKELEGGRLPVSLQWLNQMARG
jgi:hypothetical protein